MNDVSDNPPRSTRPRTHLLLKTCLGLFAIILVLPLVLGKTPLRDRVLNAIVNSDDLTVSSTDASLGFFSPLSLSGLTIDSEHQETHISVESITAEQSWIGLLFSRPDLGTFRFSQPRVDVLIPIGTGKPDTKSETGNGDVPGLLPNLAAEIVDASVVVRISEEGPPPIDITGLNATLRLKRQGTESILTLDRTTLFDHQPLTPELCGQGLQLIAPLLADEISATGEFSLNLEQFEIPIRKDPEGADGEGVKIRGQLALHSATVSMKHSMASKVISLVTQLLGKKLPDSLTVAQNVSVDFRVFGGRVYHQGLALVLPHGDSSIEIASSGSVGMDETLDLAVSLKLPEGALGSGVVGNVIAGQPLDFNVVGTLDSPKIKFTGKTGLLNSVGRLIDNTSKDGDSKADVGAAVTDILGDVLDLAKQRADRKRTGNPDQTPDAQSGGTQVPFLPRLRDRVRDRRLLPERGQRESDQRTDADGLSVPVPKGTGSDSSNPPASSGGSSVPQPI